MGGTTPDGAGWQAALRRPNGVVDSLRIPLVYPSCTPAAQDSSRRDAREAGKLFPAIRGFAARMRDRAAADLEGLLPSAEGADASLVVTSSTFLLVVLLLWLLDGSTVSFVCGEYFRGAEPLPWSSGASESGAGVLRTISGLSRYRTACAQCECQHY